MTKHDPSEVEAVSSAILDAYNTYVEGTSSLENMGGHYTQWIHEPVYPDVLAEAAITALDAHRAPAIRAAVDNYRANVEANVQWGPGENGILQRAEDSSYRELLAICGIDEQENA